MTETPRSDAFVFFGATGDLAYKQIFPSLYAMQRRGHLNMPVLGVSRSSWDKGKLVQRARDSIAEHGQIDEHVFAGLAEHLEYVAGDYQDEDTYRRLRAALGQARRPLHYLAIPPGMFDVVARGLAQSGCARDARVVVEKPFGRDLASARKLQAMLTETFAPESIFRIDHYLGKEPVQNLLYFRYANVFAEPIWNHRYIDSVQVTMAEAFGVQGRGSFYDGVGAVRDVIQNHMLQVVSLLATEPPPAGHPDAARDAQCKVFQAMCPVLPQNAVLGQFQGYQSEPGVAQGSKVETYAALRLDIDNERWTGVPFFIRSGKCLPVTATEVLVKFKPLRHAVFDTASAKQATGAAAGSQANYFRFRISPDVLLCVGARVKLPGEAMAGETVELAAHHQAADEMSPYERLLGDALRGDPALFARYESIEAAWRVVTPLLESGTAPLPYQPGSWGPQQAAGLTAAAGGWHDPQPPDSKP
ncbi:glucose-6-phosphate dehydrogenase [Candidimonas nitroreducens]|uniref:Glucose-6-phosphate 1-dehydrogenase n=1 Tax=Candidimonas nitroreducens TaxID=683354 RepID=A0A225MYR0_9BURK|nr:glucose-6-phosphate dehydrogenase [Candidimonas nitroreducens]OWT66416.1 glucose-6-phosphate dehydrogenase [Candidimonas nitroreducens]